MTKARDMASPLSTSFVPLKWIARLLASQASVIIKCTSYPSKIGESHPMNQRRHPVTVLQATQDSPTLARLTALTQESVDRLKAVEFLIPQALRSAIQPGPIDGPVWCLLVSSNAAGAKVRQLLPALQSQLRARGWEVTSIRLKVQMLPTRG